MAKCVSIGHWRHGKASQRCSFQCYFNGWYLVDLRTFFNVIFGWSQNFFQCYFNLVDIWLISTIGATFTWNTRSTEFQCWGSMLFQRCFNIDVFAGFHAKTKISNTIYPVHYLHRYRPMHYTPSNNVSTLIWYIWRPAEHVPKVVKVLIVVLRQHANRRLS